jgi:hypothetical protein
VGNSLLSKFNGVVIDIDWNPKYKNVSAVEKLILDQQKKLYLLPERQRTFFIAHHLDKQKLKKEIRNLKIDILVNQLELTKVQYAENNSLSNTLYPTSKEQLRNKEIKEQLALYTNTIEKLKALKKDNDAPLEFFDWKLDFPEAMNEKVNKEPVGFNIVIGNPPWGGGLDKDLKYLKQRYPETTLEHVDSYKLFIDASIRLVKIHGCLTMIVPNTLLRQNRLKDVRTLLLKYKLKTIINLGENIFEEAVVPSCVFTCNKEAALADHDVRYYDISKLDKREKGLYLNLLLTGLILRQKSFTENRDLEFAGKILNLSCPFVPLGDFDFFVLKDVGLQCQRKNVGKEARTKSDLATRIFIDKKLNDQSIMYWKGRDIDRYNIREITQRFFRKDFKTLIKENEVVYFNEEVYNTVPKIIFRQTADHLIAALDINKRWFDGSAIGFIPNKESEYSILYMLGLFNSSFFKWYYRRLADEEDRVFAQVKLSKVKQLPVRVIDFSNSKDKLLHDQLKKLVSRRIVNVNTTDFDIEDIEVVKIDRAIDRLVYKLYDLSYDEVCRIEGHKVWMTKEEYENFKIESSDDLHMASTV